MQYEVYHANSAMDLSSAYRFADASDLDFSSRYLGTRGFRQFLAGKMIPLERVIPSRRSLRSILASRRSSRAFRGSIQLNELSTLLEEALGCTQIIQDSTQLTHALRAWPSAGGLYPLDVYVAVQAVEQLPGGVYHYNPIRQCLEEMPCHDAAGFVGRAFFQQPIAIAASAALIFVANFERTTAKYGERGYRLALLDAGHAAQNVLLVAEQLGLGATALGGFSDEGISRDLGLDGVSEAPIHAVIVGKRDD